MGDLTNPVTELKVENLVKIKTKKETLDVFEVKQDAFEKKGSEVSVSKYGRRKEHSF